MYKICLTGFSLVCLVFGCMKENVSSHDNSKRDLSELTANERKIVNSNKNFGVTLFKEINTQDPDKNLFISPLSVSMALGMTLNGAAESTYQAMQSTLQFNGLSNQETNQAYQTLIEMLQTIDEDVLFEIANSIWYRNTFSVETDFLSTNQSYFDAQVNAADFNDLKTIDKINNWVSDNTHEKINKIIQTINPQTVMFLINAIYFNGTWKYEFDEDYTKDKTFHKRDGSVITTKMMNISANFDYYADQDVQIVDLPYGNGKFSMTVFLPTGDIEDFISSLTSESLGSYLNKLQTDSGNVYLPRLKLSYKISLKDVLSSLGMDIAFTGSADFSRINPLGQLFISDVLHKTFIQLDEEGTEAAAVTVVIMHLTSSIDPDRPFEMNINRPYFFIIREKSSETILFMGKILEPVWED